MSYSHEQQHPQAHEEQLIDYNYYDSTNDVQDYMH